MTHAELLQIQYRAQDAGNGDYIDLVAVDNYRNYLARTRPHRLPVFDSLRWEDQTKEAWHHNNARDAGEDAEPLGGPGA